MAMAALVIGLAPAVADAAPRKGTIAKKTHASAKKMHATAGKRVIRTFAVTKQRRSVVRLATVPARPSYGQLAGLHSVQDQLDLKSSVALVIDQDTNEVLFSKNGSAVLPIASLTKLMTGLVVSEAKLPMDEMITITKTWTPRGRVALEGGHAPRGGAAWLMSTKAARLMRWGAPIRAASMPSSGDERESKVWG
jgi:D-alanyl-D-alanine endopeptidase (penicillin-binding protein 7)